MKFQTATFSSSAFLKGKVMLGEEICSEKKIDTRRNFYIKISFIQFYTPYCTTEK